ncbi:hypothetical protein, partial [Acidithiobacillus albertensis]|uniref:hypothetical protein n=1 Tax=Acidithiobacillus albertensis TaxID=119978 RepID=UPI000B0E74F8
VQMIQTAHFGYGFHANHSSFLPANPAGYQVVNLHAVFHPILATFARCLTVTDEPALAPLLSSLEGGSVWSLAGGGLAGGSLAAVGPLMGGQYTERTQLVKALGYDMNQVSNYMVPINGDVANFAAQANTLTQSLSQ